jgi:hypothetical protein
MPELDLTQPEADALIAMEKFRVDDDVHDYPTAGGQLTLPLLSRDKRESFFLDITRGRIDFHKGTYQNRAKLVIPLVRVDFGGHPHTNPDGETIQTPHIHVYREGFGDKYASPLPAESFPNTDDPWKILQSFYTFCSIVEPPNVRQGLFT